MFIDIVYGGINIKLFLYFLIIKYNTIYILKRYSILYRLNIQYDNLNSF
jgi:hypothetical protein